MTNFDIYVSLIKIFNKRDPGWDIAAYQKIYKMGKKTSNAQIEVDLENM